MNDGVRDEAALIYQACKNASCAEVAVESVDGVEGLWNVFDAPGGTRLASTTPSVLLYLTDHYADLEIVMVNGSEW